MRKQKLNHRPVKGKTASRKGKDTKVIIENDETEDEPEAIPERLGGNLMRMKLFRIVNLTRMMRPNINEN